MDFIVELPPCRPADSDTRIQGLQQSETCTGGVETWAGDVGRAGFHLLNSPFSVLHLKNDKVAPWRRLGERWARSYSQEQAQFFKLEAAFGQRSEGEVFPHFINELGSLCLSFTISGTSPSPLRSPGQTQPPYSRVETHGRRVTSWSPLGFRTDEEEERGWEKSASRSFLFLRWMCERSNDSLGSAWASPMGGRKPPRGARSNSVVTFPFMW